MSSHAFKNHHEQLVINMLGASNNCGWILIAVR